MTAALVRLRSWGPSELFLCAGVAVAAAAALHFVGSSPGDAEVHLYRTFLVRHGTFLWDNYWYEGDYPLTSYSLLYYLGAAVTGNLPLVGTALIVSAVLFASVVRREWGAAARWPGRAFAVFAATPFFTGLFTYSLGLMGLLATIRAVQSRRTALALVFAALTLGFSPLAFGFLLLVLLALLVVRHRPTTTTVVLGAGLLGLAGFEAVLLHLFPAPGVYRFHAINLAAVLTVCAFGFLLARHADRAAVIEVFFVLWGVTSIAIAAIPNPIGDNWTRLGEVMFPVMLLTAVLARFQPRRLALLALTAALSYTLVPHLLLIPYRLDTRPATERFWESAIGFLHRHNQAGYRVEVVPTAAHWEAYWIPRAGYPLARGWYRQLDIVDNPLFYAKTLDASTYERWLRSVAVEYILLPATKLDPIGGPIEAALLRSGPRGITVAYHSADVTIYRLAHPTPLLTGPGQSSISLFGHTRIEGAVGRRGTYLLRVHYIPFWNATPGVCTAPSSGGMTLLRVSAPGRFALQVAPTTEAFERAALGSPRCAPLPASPRAGR